MLAGLLAGTILGLIFGEKMAAFRLLGDLFITLLQMAAIPLIFFNVITAIARLPDFTTMRRIGVMIMAYYIITTACAAAIGMTVMSVLKIGSGFRLDGADMNARLVEIAGVELLDAVVEQLERVLRLVGERGRGQEQYEGEGSHSPHTTTKEPGGSFSPRPRGRLLSIGRACGTG